MRMRITCIPNFQLTIGRLYKRFHFFSAQINDSERVQQWCRREARGRGRAPQLCKGFLEIRAYKNHYSVVKGHFGLKAVEKPLFHKV